MGRAATFYSWMTAALGPLVVLHLQARKMRGRELAEHGPERCGYPSALRPKGLLLWFHAVSVGEGMEALPVIKKCLQTRPHVNILMTTSTVTALYVVIKLFSPLLFGPPIISALSPIPLPRVISTVQFDSSTDSSPGGDMPSIPTPLSRHGIDCVLAREFAPVDTPSAVERFLSFWQPQAAVFMESELWPNLILKSSKKGVLLGLLNARISPKSLWRWSLSPAKNLAAEIISKFSLIMPVNNKEAVRYQELGACAFQIQFAGNLKYASGAMDFVTVNGPIYHDLRRQLLGRRVWLAASTHPGEEEVVVSIHKKLMSTFPTLLTIIVPRHPHRGQFIKSEIRHNYQWEAPRRSLNEPLIKNTEIYIADTLGELAMFYHLVSLVFVGGSLFENLQGHNIAEPASAGCAIVTGFHVGHFQEMVAEMQRHSPLSIEQVAGEDGLCEFVHSLLDNGRSLNLRREAALSAANSAAANVMQRVYRWLNYVILNPAFGSAGPSE